MADAPLIAPVVDHDELTGMALKRQRHYLGQRWMLLGKTATLCGIMIFAAMCLLWSQVLYPLVLNAKVAFEVVIDAKDQAAQSPSYMAFLQGLGVEEQQQQHSQYALHSFYVWNVTNTLEVLQLGYKPQMQQVGPYGYVKREQKYDVQFSEGDDSATVSYKQWHYLDPVAEPSDCAAMHYRIGRAKLDMNDADCANSTCDCRPFAAAANDTVTVVNAPFMRLLHEETPQGLLASTAQEAFAHIEQSLTGEFLTAVKSAFLPERLDAAWRYRRAAATSALLQTVYQSIAAASSAAAARSAFIAAGTADATVSCGAVSVPLHSTCPWGVGQHIIDAAAELGVPAPATVALTAAEADHLLGLRASALQGALTSAALGVPLWVAAGRHLAMPNVYTNSYKWPTRSPGEPDDAVQWQALVTLLCSWEPAESGTLPPTDGSLEHLQCQAKVQGVAHWLYTVWYTESSLGGAVAAEWISTSSSSALPCDIALQSCSWSIGASLNTQGLSAAAAQRIADPALADFSNLLSVHTFAGLNYWADAQAYCTAPSTACAELSAEVRLAAEVALPAALAAADGAAAADLAVYLPQVCAVSDYLFRLWAADSLWLSGAVAQYASTALQTELAGDAPALSATDLSGLGYAQWAGGHTTRMLYGLPSLSAVSYNSSSHTYRCYC
jgi:CD36 family